MSERLRWILGGAAGLLLAVGLAFVTSDLTETPVGLAGEPVSAGEALAPAADPAPGAGRTTTAPPATQPRTTTEPPATTRPADPPPPTTTTSPPSDEDSSGPGSGDDSDQGRGRGRGRGGDD